MLESNVSFLVSWGGVRLSALGTLATSWPAVPAPDDECGAVGGIIIVRRNKNTLIKPDPLPLYLPQIPLNLTWAQTRAAAVGSLGLTA
jgi:hypothetical protein